MEEKATESLFRQRDPVEIREDFLIQNIAVMKDWKDHQEELKKQRDSKSMERMHWAKFIQRELDEIKW